MSAGVGSGLKLRREDGEVVAVRLRVASVVVAAEQPG